MDGDVDLVARFQLEFADDVVRQGDGERRAGLYDLAGHLETPSVLYQYGGID